MNSSVKKKARLSHHDGKLADLGQAVRAAMALLVVHQATCSQMSPSLNSSYPPRDDIIPHNTLVKVLDNGSKG